MTVIAINCMEARPANFHFRSDARLRNSAVFAVLPSRGRL